MVHVQERAPLLDRDDVEAGPAHYGASTPSAADAASTVGVSLYTTISRTPENQPASQSSKGESGQKCVTPSSQGDCDIMCLQPHGFQTTLSLCKSLFFPSLYHFSFRSSLGGDVLAGVSLAAMLIPQSVSYGASLAKIGPTAGLVSSNPFVWWSTWCYFFLSVRSFYTSHSLQFTWNLKTAQCSSRSCLVVACWSSRYRVSSRVPQFFSR